MIINLTDENFEKEIQSAVNPVLVDFFAPWCSPCFILAPIIEKIAADFEGRVILAKANLDEMPQTAQKLGVDRVPIVALFKKGKLISGFVGLRPEDIIREWLENELKKDDGPKSETQEVEEMIKNYADYSRSNGFKLNPDKAAVERIMKGLLANEKKHGKKYCPCRRVTGNAEEDAKNICPCAYHRQELEKEGHCLCWLFVK